MNKDFVIECHQVVKSYRVGSIDVPVLTGVNWNITRGKWTALLGDSGSGKTTLMNLISSLERPTSGKIEVDGMDLSSLSSAGAAAFRANKLGFVFQSYHLLPELTVLENVMMPALLSGKSASIVRQDAVALLSKMGLDGRLKHLPSELSGGEQQRGAIARALINRPPLIMADEPTGNVDSHTGDEILKLFCQLRLDNHSIVMITHSPRVAEMADEVFYLESGRISVKK